MIGKGRCDKGFIENPSNCERECDKSCDIGQYLDFENCKCRKNLISKLVEECSENIDKNEMIHNVTLNYHWKASNVCAISIVLLLIIFIISISIGSAFIYFHWYLNRSNNYVNTSTNFKLKQQYTKHKWEVSNKLILRIVHITFLMTWSISKVLIETY